jgi:hypothetical protein
MCGLHERVFSLPYSPLHAEWRKLNSRQKWMVSALLVAACALWGWRSNLLTVVDAWGTPEQSDILQNDEIDTLLIVQGLRAAPAWKDTLRWWKGAWVMGDQYPYYRPLLSSVWWLEYRAFGERGLAGFLAIHTLLHVAVALMALGFLREVLGLRLATASLVCWALNLPFVVACWPAPYVAMPMWKDDAELWYSLGVIVALWCLLRWLRGGRGTWLAAAFIAFAIGLGFKEAALVTPLLAVLLVAYEANIPTWQDKKIHGAKVWGTIAAFFIVAAAFYAFRWWVLSGPGFRFGSNGEWLFRWFAECVGGAPGAHLWRGDGLPLAVACVVLASYCSYGVRSWMGAAGWSAGALALLAITEAFYSSERGEIFWRLILFISFGGNVPWSVYLSAMFMYLYSVAALVLWVRFLTHPQRGQWFGYGWLFLAYLPMLYQTITPHALYLMSLGWAIWLAGAILGALCVLEKWWCEGNRYAATRVGALSSLP